MGSARHRSRADLHVVVIGLPGVADPLVEGAAFVFHLADVVAGIDWVFQYPGEIFRQSLLINSNMIASVRRLRPGAFVYGGTACSFLQTRQTGVDAPLLRE